MASQSDQDWQLTKKTVLERISHMFNNPLMSDIKFTCGESKRKYFYAHKYVLAISSPVFYTMFYGHLAEKNSVIHLPDTDEESFEEFLRILYTDKCTLTPEIAGGVMYLAKKYMVPSLATKCIRIMQNGLNLENVFTILDQVTHLHEEELQKKCWEVVCSQTHEAVTSDNFINASKQTVDNLLKQDTLAVREVELFNAVLKWCDHECSREGLEASGENKRAILGEAVYEIRFLSMTQEEFAQNVSSSGVLSSEEVVSIYDDFIDTEVPSFKCKLSKRKQFIHRCSRFNDCQRVPLKLPCTLTRHHGLGFSVSVPVMLHGVRLLGCKGSPNITSFIVNFKEVKVHITNFSEKGVDHGLPGFDVMLPTPISVKRNKVVSLVVELSTYYRIEAHCGRDGKTSVTINGVTVTFSNVEIEGKQNRTNVNSGQFHQILFTRY